MNHILESQASMLKKQLVKNKLTMRIEDVQSQVKRQYQFGKSHILISILKVDQIHLLILNKR